MSIRRGDFELKARWRRIFERLPRDSRIALREALLALRDDCRGRAEHQWRRHKGPMALYWRVVGVYAGHLARAIPTHP